MCKTSVWFLRMVLCLYNKIFEPEHKSKTRIFVMGNPQGLGKRIFNKLQHFDGYEMRRGFVSTEVGSDSVEVDADEFAWCCCARSEVWKWNS